MQIATAVSQIRRGLGRPHFAQISDPDILLEIWEVVAYYKSVLNLTNQGWNLKRKRFFVDAGTITEMNLNADSFGSAVFATSIDDTNPYFIKRTIDVVGPEQMSKYFSGPTNLQVGSGWYTPHVAQVFAIWRQSGEWKISWLPAHLQTAEYELWYTEGAAVLPPLFDDNLNFPIEDSSFLIIADCIINLLPMLADPKLGLDEQQKLLLATAQKKVAQYTPILEAQRWEIHKEPTQRRKVFGQRRSNLPNY